ncbi:MAG: hypothetical protein ACLFPX_08010 [Candidatus Omnitrophota bacterium]
MKYADFQNTFPDDRIIDIRNAETFFNGLDRRRLYEWQKQGHIRKITNGFYLFTKTETDDVLLKNIASHIYTPSYVGLQSALSWYNFIPEAVFQTVSITTRRKKIFKTSSGTFQYHSIRKPLFFGYIPVREGNRWFYISDPEKTLLDTFYFTPASDKRDVLDALRLNTEEIRSTVNMTRLGDYLKIFSSPKIDQAVENLRELIHDQL